MLSKKQKSILLPYRTVPGSSTELSSIVTARWVCQWLCPSPAYSARTGVGTSTVAPPGRYTIWVKPMNGSPAPARLPASSNGPTP